MKLAEEQEVQDREETGLDLHSGTGIDRILGALTGCVGATWERTDQNVCPQPQSRTRGSHLRTMRCANQCKPTQHLRVAVLVKVIYNVL